MNKYVCQIKNPKIHSSTQTQKHIQLNGDINKGEPLLIRVMVLLH